MGDSLMPKPTSFWQYGFYKIDRKNKTENEFKAEHPPLY